MSDNAPTSYTTSHELARFTSSPSEFRKANPHLDALISGAVVTDASGRILILRRAAHDSWPLLWEVPGGCVDATDASPVAAAVRELWEETGLRATHVRKAVPPIAVTSEAAAWSTSSAGKGGDDAAEALVDGVRMVIGPGGVAAGDMCLFRESGIWGKLTAWIDVESCETVRIDDNEHADWAWISEDEVVRGRFADGRELDMVSESVTRTLLEGFRLWKEAYGPRT